MVYNLRHLDCLVSEAVWDGILSWCLVFSAGAVLTTVSISCFSMVGNGSGLGYSA
jgi:hypothetical protein